MEALFIVCLLVFPVYYVLMKLMGSLISSWDSDDPMVGSEEDYINYELKGDIDSDPEPSLGSPEEILLEAEIESDPSLDDLDHHLEKQSVQLHDIYTGYTINYWSLRIWSLIISMFGLGGCLGWFVYDKQPLPAFAWGGVFAIFAAIILFGFFHIVFENSTFHSYTPTLLGKIGKVVVSVPEEGFGLVEVELEREKQFYKAKSKNEKSIEFGEKVVITGVVKNSRIITVDYSA